jgi:hypothetical protein
VELTAGGLQAESATAFGTGDVYVSGGTLTVATAQALKLAGKYTQLTGATTTELVLARTGRQPQRSGYGNHGGWRRTHPLCQRLQAQSGR